MRERYTVCCPHVSGAFYIRCSARYHRDFPLSKKRKKRKIGPKKRPRSKDALSAKKGGTAASVVYCKSCESPCLIEKVIDNITKKSLGFSTAVFLSGVGF